MQQRPLSETLPAASPTPPGRGRWNWQRVARGAWLALALVLLVNFVANIPAFYQSSFTFCTLPNPTECATGLLTLGNVQALDHLHLSVTAVAIFLATLTVAVSVVYWLVALYVGLILALQALVRAVTGGLSQQPLVIVCSTLVIAALFQPLRRRIQNIIDRRFYRHKYDAAKVVAAFGTTLRQEVDLDQLRQQLLEVVQETIQPSHVSLWLRQPTRSETSALQADKPPAYSAGVHESIVGHGV